MTFFKPPTTREELRVIPFGGCGEFGMNLTNYLYDGKLFVVDAGVLFPDSTKLGVDAIIPHVDEYYAEAGGVHAYVITHGHEDHIGALPHLFERWPASIYATPWTAALIRRKFERLNIVLPGEKLHVVDAGDQVKTDGISFKYIHVNHSIPHACSLLIKTDHHSVLHTGDFKCEDDPVMDVPYDEVGFMNAGIDGVDLLLSDSTNAHKSGRCPGEKTVLPAIQKICRESDKAVILTTFSSNLWRLKTFIDAAQSENRKVLIAGRGIETTLEVAAETGVYTPPQNILIDPKNAGNLARKNIMVIATGCQGEWRAAVNRMAQHEYKNFRLEAGDTIAFSSRIIPGNEKSILNMTNKLLRLGLKIITSNERADIHVSGHAHAGDLEIIVRCTKPKYHVPVHGTIFHQQSNMALASHQPFPIQDIHMTNGNVFSLKGGVFESIGEIDVDIDFVDGDSRAVMTRETLRERLRIGELGAAHLGGIYSIKKRQWLRGPDISFQGLALPNLGDLDRWRDDLCAILTSKAASFAKNGAKDEVAFNEQLRIALRRELAGMLNKKPVVLTNIYLV